ncbi:MAG: T9SS type A sorting domain-containing protein [Bacteroidetes bacterium]|nr:T9SS type A sorting domain-containing protein [Bacteroidota bacterium]
MNFSKKLFFAVILFAFLSINNFVNAQGFNSISTADGINVIAVGNTGTSGKNVYRSYNGGNSWAAYEITGVNLKSVCSFNNDVWISGDNGNIYKTQKNNSPINTINTGISSSINSVFFINENEGYFCGNGGSINKSIDGGANWTSVNTGIPSVKLNSISFLDNQKGIVVGDNGTVYLTTNGGTSWTSENTGVTKNLLKVKYFSNGIVITGEYGSLIIKNGNSPWSVVNTRVNADIMGLTGTDINNVHICGGGGFIRNNTNGNSRFYNFEINPMLANLVDLIYSDSQTGYAVSSLNKAIIKTTNGGALWSLTAGATISYQWLNKLNAGSGIGNNLCPHPFDRNTMFVVYGSTVYVSRNRGDNWTSIANITGGGSAHSFYVSPLDTNIWVCAITSGTDRVTRTTNYGVTWTTVISRNFSNYGQPLEMDQNEPNNYYFAPDNGGFYRSTDNGATFNEISNNYPFRSPCDIVVMWDSSNVIFVGDGVTGSGQAQIFKSVNRGVNWTLVETVGSSETPSLCNTVFDQRVMYATEWSGSTIYKTTDYGDNWGISHANGFSGWASGFCQEDPTVILTGNYGPQAAISTNFGATWNTSTSGMSGAGAGMWIQSRDYMLSMQTGGIYKLKIDYSVITSVSENSISGIIPDNYSLEQNYPNPFNPSTIIKFSVPVSGNVSLKVYNQIGKEVETLSDGFKNAGSYEINFNAAALSSGVYFYKLETNGYTQTKKMLLVK